MNQFPRYLAPILGPDDSGSYVGSVDVINPNTPDAELLQMLRVPLPWAQVPDQNKRLMIATCGEVLQVLTLPKPE